MKDVCLLFTRFFVQKNQFFFFSLSVTHSKSIVYQVMLLGGGERVMHNISIILTLHDEDDNDRLAIIGNMYFM